jgi:hypothetical protein
MSRLLFSFSLCLLFLGVQAQFETVGIIGSATPNGWDASTAMEQDADNPNIWRITIELANGEAKFRADNDWAVNWGDTKFPIGTGTQNGPNIPIIGGNYVITFNSETGAYFFDYQDSNFGVIGAAIPGTGWGRDVFMFRDAENPALFFITLDLVPDGIKFRENSDWATNWGGDTYPSGVGIPDGPNINIPNAGTYFITFNRETLEYNFEEQVDFTTIGLIGSATPGDWAEDTPMNRDPFNPSLWTVTIELKAGEFKIRANNDWGINWGGETFPNGVGIPGGPNIIVGEDQAGTYLASFNTESLQYRFVQIIDYPEMGIIGSAAQFGYDAIVPMVKDPQLVYIWTLRAKLTEGELFFSVDNTFADESTVWGGTTFPSGDAINDVGLGIPAEAGEYRITFNSALATYNFERIVEYSALSLVGKSGPFNTWPSEADAGSTDFFLEKDAEDGNIWYGFNITLRNFADDDDGGIKFRVDTAWAINWGAEEFPAGVGVRNGPNIRPIAGVYNTVFNSITGEYAFSPATSTKEEMLNPASVVLMPNPAKSLVTLRIDFPHFKGDTQITLFDVTGKMVYNQSFNSTNDIQLNVAHLKPGFYFVQVKNGHYFTTKKLNVVH